MNRNKLEAAITTRLPEKGLFKEHHKYHKKVFKQKKNYFILRPDAI